MADDTADVRNEPEHQIPSVAQLSFELFGGGVLPDWDIVEPVVESVRAPAGGVIFEVDVHHPYVYVVLSGAAKLVARDAKGAEHLVGLARAGELLASVRALAPDGLAQYVDHDLIGSGWQATDTLGTTDTRAIAVTDCALERVDFRVVRSMMLSHGGTWATAVYNAVVHYALVEEHRARQFLMTSAEDRYRHFLSRYPDLVGVLPQKDIGNYVGVTPVGISRIASRVRQSG